MLYNALRALAAALVVACASCLCACVSAFLLRETIAHTFGGVSAASQLRRYADSEAVRARWDSLQVREIQIIY